MEYAPPHKKRRTQRKAQKGMLVLYVSLSVLNVSLSRNVLKHFYEKLTPDLLRHIQKYIPSHSTTPVPQELVENV